MSKLLITIARNTAPFSIAQNANLRKLLPLTVCRTADSYYRWQDRQAHMIGRYLLMMSLERFGYTRAKLNSIRTSVLGRPSLDEALDFNISHSGEFVVCALGSECRLGVDVEKIVEIDIKDFEEQFSPSVLSAIQNADNSNREFFRHWTIKESVVKADGCGLSTPLNLIEIGECIIVNEKKWYISPIEIHLDYISHIACDKLMKTITVEKIALPT